jgi:5-methyltetrahydropteroyltriglutamate--homocysteine methyltransferase
MAMAITPFRTAIVGSYCQPDWLLDRENLKSRLPPRVRAKEIWRVEDALLKSAQDDATILAIHDQERAGIDIIGDGEMRRESYSNQVANSLGGIDPDRHGTAMDRTGKPNPVPLVSGPIVRAKPIEVENVKFLRAETAGPIKITLPGPFTMAQQAQNDYYKSEAELAMAFADALNEEIRDLFVAGADIVQIDEPYLQARPGPAAEYGVAAIDRALQDTGGTTALHNCFGYAHVHGNEVAKPSGYDFLPQLANCVVDVISIEAAQPNLDLGVLEALSDKTIMLGVIDLSDFTVETPEVVADRLGAGLAVLSADQIIAAPDCGMKYLNHDIAFGKLKALVDGAKLAREKLL